MTEREVVRLVFSGQKPPYVPWHFQFTQDPREQLCAHFGGEDAAEQAIDNHILELGSAVGFFENIGNLRFRDVFGVTWDRRVDKDIGIVEGCVLSEPTLKDYRFPNPLNPRFFRDNPAKIVKSPDRFRIFYVQPIPTQSYGHHRAAGGIPRPPRLPRRPLDATRVAVSHQGRGPPRVSPVAGTGTGRQLHLRAGARGAERCPVCQHARFYRRSASATKTNRVRSSHGTYQF